MLLGDLYYDADVIRILNIHLITGCILLRIFTLLVNIHHRDVNFQFYIHSQLGFEQRN